MLVQITFLQVFFKQSKIRVSGLKILKKDIRGISCDHSISSCLLTYLYRHVGAVTDTTTWLMLSLNHICSKPMLQTFHVAYILSTWKIFSSPLVATGHWADFLLLSKTELIWSHAARFLYIPALSSSSWCLRVHNSFVYSFYIYQAPPSVRHC